MTEHYKHELNHDHEPTGDQLLHQARVEGDRKFWSGERSLTLVQVIGLLLIFIAEAVLLGTSNYRIFAWVMGGLVAFVFLGNRWARRRNKHNSYRN